MRPVAARFVLVRLVATRPIATRLVLLGALAACLACDPAETARSDRASQKSSPSPSAAWLLIDHLTSARQEIPTALAATAGSAELDRRLMRSVYQHAPSRLVFDEMRVPAGGALLASFGIKDEAAQPGSDGVTFRISVRTNDERAEIFSQHLDPANASGDVGWHDIRIPLIRFEGQTIRLEFETLTGPEDRAENTGSYDQAYWGEPRVVAFGGDARRNERPNLLVVSFDTLRADFLTSYGGREDTSPATAGLARRGARFERSIAAAPWTLPSHFALFTGLDPDRTLLLFDRKPCRIAGSVETLAEMLDAQGYHTGAITGGGFVAPKLGFGQGFHSFESSGRRFEDNLPQIEKWIDAYADETFFLFLHNFNVHRDYTPPPEFLDRFVANVPPGCEGVSFSSEDRRTLRRAECMSEAGGLDYLRGVYAAEVAYADSLLGEVISSLEARGALSNTIVVVTSDHGEELYEHLSFDHVRTVYEEVLRVPLIIAGPGVAEGVTVEGLSSHVDLVPTLSDLLGFDISGEIDGMSHIEAIDGSGPASTSRELAFSATALDTSLDTFAEERAGFIAAVAGRDRKLIRYGEGENATSEFFVLSDDPVEQAPRASGRDASDAELEAALDRWTNELPARAYCIPADADAQLLQQLKALGYVDAP